MSESEPLELAPSDSSINGPAAPLRSSPVATFPHRSSGMSACQSRTYGAATPRKSCSPSGVDTPPRAMPAYFNGPDGGNLVASSTRRTKVSAGTISEPPLRVLRTASRSPQESRSPASRYALAYTARIAPGILRGARRHPGNRPALPRRRPATGPAAGRAAPWRRESATDPSCPAGLDPSGWRSGHGPRADSPVVEPAQRPPAASGRTATSLK